jgi:hypothetical protein
MDSFMDHLLILDESIHDVVNMNAGAQKHFGKGAYSMLQNAKKTGGTFKYKGENHTAGRITKGLRGTLKSPTTGRFRTKAGHDIANIGLS